MQQSACSHTLYMYCTMCHCVSNFSSSMPLHNSRWHALISPPSLLPFPFRFPYQDHNHLWVVQTVQGDPFREVFLRRSVESFRAQLEARKRKVDSPLQDLGVGETGPTTKKARISLDEGILQMKLCTYYTLHGAWTSPFDLSFNSGGGKREFAKTLQHVELSDIQIIWKSVFKGLN